MGISHLTKLNQYSIVIKAEIIKNSIEIFRYPWNLLFRFLWPVVWILPSVLAAQAFAPQGRSDGLQSFVKSDNFLQFYGIGLIYLHGLSTLMTGIGVILRRMMIAGVIETIWSMPAPRIVVIMGDALFGILMIIYDIFVLISVASIIFGSNFLLYMLTILPYYILFLIVAFGLGALLGGIVLLVKDAIPLLDFLSYLVTSLSGCNNPVQAFPKWIAMISMIIPTTYFIDYSRFVLIGSTFLVTPKIELYLMLFSIVILPVVGCMIFLVLDRKMRNNGTVQHF